MMEMTTVIVLFTRCSLSGQWGIIILWISCDHNDLCDFDPQDLPSVKNIGGDLMEMRGTLPDVDAVYNVLQADITEKLLGERTYGGFQRTVEFKMFPFLMMEKGRS